MPESPDITDALDAIIDADNQRIRANAILENRVLIARAEGATWQEIADCLGVTRQSAHARFSRTLSLEDLET